MRRLYNDCVDSFLETFHFFALGVIMGTVAQNESFSLRWNDYSHNLKMAFLDLRQKLDFCDLTLITDDGSLKAHQVILR
jgi:hypothetical protein